MVNFRLSFAFSFLLANIDSSACFAFVPRPVVQNVVVKQPSNIVRFANSHPEFKVVGGDDEVANDEVADDEETMSTSGSGDYFVVNNVEEIASASAEEETATSQRPEYGALSQGTVAQVQIGDLSLARKAWKKRRRTGSPLLVPCSVLNVDRQSMVRWNLIYLLEKFGASRKDGIEITDVELSKRYRSFFKSSLQKQVIALGHESNQEMIIALFNKKTQESYGIRLVENEEGQLSLKAPISRQKAHRRADGTPVLQFRLPRSADHGDVDTLTHTGYVKSRQPNSSDRAYHFLPLSAALRVSQKDDIDTGRVEQGSIHPAVVFDYDVAGDGGSPLLTLSLNPGGAREALKVKPDRKYMPIQHPQELFHELSAGDGPFRAKVVRLIPGKALIDFEVGKKVSSEGFVKVLGTLSFRDSVDIKEDIQADVVEVEDYEDATFDVIEAAIGDLDHDDEEEDKDGLVEDLLSLRESSTFEEGTFEEGEEEEDVSDQFKLNEDGSLSYSDPATGETIVLNSDDENFEEMMLVKSQIDSHADGFAEEPIAKESRKSLVTTESALSPRPKFSKKMLRVGDDVDVYIRSVSKQSGQFTVTTNPLVQGKKAKDLKKVGDAAKRLKRLKKTLGGSLQKIWDLEGEECDGTVKATSKTGDWVYVQPNLSGLPVGVAILSETLDVSAGDTVRVRISGVDEERGQLAMEVIDKA